MPLEAKVIIEIVTKTNWKRVIRSQKFVNDASIVVLYPFISAINQSCSGTNKYCCIMALGHGLLTMKKVSLIV